MNIVKHTYPWEHYTIDNVLSKDELKKIQAFAQLKESKFSNEKEKQVIQYEDWDDKDINNIVNNLVKKVKEFCFANLNLFPRTEINETEYINVVDFQYSPPAPYSYPIHPESSYKKISFIVYIAPKKDNGTHLYVSKYSSKPNKTVHWKENRGMLFSGVKNVTWHNYSTLGNKKRITLNNCNGEYRDRDRSH